MSKLTDKAKGISFDDVDEPTPELPADRPRTAIGAISASIAMGRGVEAENRELRAKLEHFEDAQTVDGTACSRDSDDQLHFSILVQFRPARPAPWLPQQPES